jgi:hypothetical protein
MGNKGGDQLLYNKAKGHSRKIATNSQCVFDGKRHQRHCIGT